jgi:hypothetical protein
MLIRNDVLRSVPPLPTGEPWGKVADAWLFLQLCLRGDVGFIPETLMRYRVHGDSMMAEAYADGSFFRRHLATANDALAWWEVRAWFTAAERRDVMQRVAMQATTSLPIIRNSYTRKVVVRAFMQILRAVPSTAMRPDAWARLAFGLLPSGLITRLRARRRSRWTARNPDLLHSP